MAGRSPRFPIPAYGPIFEADLARHFQPGENTLAVHARSVPGPTAFFLQGRIEFADGRVATWSTDISGRSSKLLHPNWQTRPLSKKWRRAVSFGPVSSQPWRLSGNDIGLSPLDNYEQWKQALNAGGFGQLAGQRRGGNHAAGFGGFV